MHRAAPGSPALGVARIPVQVGAWPVVAAVGGRTWERKIRVRIPVVPLPDLGIAHDVQGLSDLALV